MLAVDDNKAPNPFAMSLLGEQAVVFEADAIADAIEETGRGRMIHFTLTFRLP